MNNNVNYANWLFVIFIFATLSIVFNVKVNNSLHLDMLVILFLANLPFMISLIKELTSKKEKSK